MVEYEYLLNSDWQKSIGVKPVLYDFAEDLMIFCIAYPALFMIGRFFEEGVGLYFRMFILFIAMIALTVNRRKSKRIYAFVLILFGIAALAAFIPMNLPMKLEMTGAVLIAAMVSITRLAHDIRRKRCKDDPSMQSGRNIFMNFSIPGIGFSCIYITYMISYALKRREMLFVCLVSLTILLLCYAVYTHKVGTFRLTESNKSQPSITRKMISFSRIFSFYAVAFVAAIGFLTIVVVQFTGIGRVDDWIIYVLTYTNAGAKFKPPPVTEATSPIDFTKVLGLGNKPSSQFMLILDRVLGVVFWIIFAAALLIVFLLLFRLLFRLVKKSREHINEETRSTLSIRNVTDEAAARLKKSRIVALFAGSSNNMKIRRLYYRLIKKYRTKGVQITNADSPTEIGSKIEKYSGTTMKDVTHVYQKARYGFKDCDRNDVERIKTELKQ